MLTSAHFRNFLPVTVDIDCWGETHRVEWTEGVLSANDHPSNEEEETLAALGGTLPPCLDQVRAYQTFLQIPDHFHYIGTDPSQMTYAPADHPLRILHPKLKRRAAAVVIHVLRYYKTQDDRDLRIWLVRMTSPVAEEIFRETFRLDRYERLRGVNVGIGDGSPHTAGWQNKARWLSFSVSSLWLADVWGRGAERIGELVLVSIERVLQDGFKIEGEAIGWNDNVPFARPFNLSVVISAHEGEGWVLEESAPLP